MCFPPAILFGELGSMKPPLLGLFCGAACLFAAEGRAEVESYLLAKKDPPVVVGSKLTSEDFTAMKDATFIYKLGDVKVAGTRSFKSVEVVTKECLSPTRFRRIQSKLEQQHRTIISGEIEEEPGEPEPLTGIPVILEKKADGSFTATLEKGEATPKQRKKLDALAREATAPDDLTMFGEQPRKPGDKWEVDVTKLSEFGDAKDLRGTMQVEFTGIEELQGMRCAVLKSTFDMTGTEAADNEDETEMKVAMKGEEIFHRSLNDTVTLQALCEARMTLKAEVEGAPMELEGPVAISIRSTLAKPAKAEEKTAKALIDKDKAQVLAEEGKRFPWPAGSKLEEESVAVLKDMQVRVTTKDGETVKSSSSRTDTFGSEIEVLAPGKTRHIQRKAVREGVMKIGAAEEKAIEPASQTVVDVPVIVEASEGEVRAALEVGEPSSAEERVVDRLRGEMARYQDLILYGNTPRKPGDKWEADVGKLHSFAGGKNLQGSFTVEFLRIEEYGGEPCAVLKLVFDLNGIPVSRNERMESHWKLQGESMVHRSLADRVDRQSNLKGTMTLDEERPTGEKSHASAPFTMVTKARLKKP